MLPPTSKDVTQLPRASLLPPSRQPHRQPGTPARRCSACIAWRESASPGPCHWDPRGRGGGGLRVRAAAATSAHPCICDSRAIWTGFLPHGWAMPPLTGAPPPRRCRIRQSQAVRGAPAGWEGRAPASITRKSQPAQRATEAAKSGARQAAAGATGQAAPAPRSACPPGRA